MRTLSSLLLLCLLVISCNNSEKKEKETAKSTTETMTETNTESPYKYSLAQWSVHLPIKNGTMDAMDFADYAKKLGFEGVEYVDQLYELDDSLSYKDGVMKLAGQWKERSAAAGVENVLIMIDRAGELADPSEEKRKEAIEMHKNWVDGAELLGAKALRVNLFGLNEVEAWHNACVASLKELAGYAATKNIKILVENHAQLSNDASLVAAVIEAVNLPNCGTLPDFGNFCVEREGGERWGPAPCIKEYDAYKGIAELMPYAGGVSAKSNAFDENGDETEIDYYRMMQIVKDAGFSGYIGIEHEDKVTADPTAGIMATKALVIKALEQAK
ncbi:MAG: sugar phosphate isomerase/epimerase family protein [Bacteroidota bacterium]